MDSEICQHLGVIGDTQANPWLKTANAMSNAYHSHFPPPQSADESGLVALTDEMNTNLLLDAYYHGIFPWSEGPVRWYSPDPRAIFLKDRIKLPGKLGKIIRKSGFVVTFDTAFKEVITACADTPREGSWISDAFITHYTRLHEMGYAHSAEVWQGERLVGGLYGVQIGGFFAGESMFHHASNASKVAFAALIEQLDLIGIRLIDAQVLNDHTAKLGAVLVHRRDYLYLLERAIHAPVRFDAEKWPSTPLKRDQE